MSDAIARALPRYFSDHKSSALWILAIVILAVSIIVNMITAGTHVFPPSVSEAFPFASWVNGGEDWLRQNYRWLTRAIAGIVRSWLDSVETFLILLPWPITIAAVTLPALKFGGIRLALFCILAMMFWGVVDMWDSAMETLSLMIVSVVIAVVVGVTTGIAASQNDRFEAFVRPVLDTMQTMPSFVYLIPAVFFFGIGGPPAIIATVIYAIPPAVRLTNLGIRQVSPQTLEAAQSFGSTPLQLLLKVKLPLAMPSIMMGINQTVMMALGMVVIATFIGAGGLGYEVWQALRQLKIGWSLEAGTSIVLMAIIFDRISYAMSEEGKSAHLQHAFRLLPRKFEEHRWAQAFENVLGSLCRVCNCATHGFAALLAGIAVPIARLASEDFASDLRSFIRHHAFFFMASLIVVVVYMIDAYIVSYGDYPKAWQFSIRAPADAALDWLKTNPVFFGITTWIRWFVFAWMLDPLADFLIALPWWYALALSTALVWFSAGRLLAVITFTALLFLGASGLWEVSMFTLATILVSATLCVILGVPTGVMMSVSDTFETIMKPILDAMQTMPAFVYLVPVLMFFGGNVVSAVIATVIYALPPLIRLTNLGVREVPHEAIEAARSFGSTFMQILLKVKMPMALPSIMMGINQAVMMALAMTILTPLIGGGGLGQEVFNALATSDTGEGLQAGLGIVFIAIVLDRLTQAWSVHRQQAIG